MPHTAAPAPVLTVAAAEFGYAGQAAVAADLTVASGEVVALLGPNGSGKSTLVKGVLGLTERLAGTVAWFGQPLERLDRRWRIGYVPQRQLAASPVPVTVTELVRSGRRPRVGLGRPLRAADRDAVARAIAMVGLADRAKSDLSELSGGQQRRALVARGLVGGAEVLLLDEPFAGVDREHQQAIADILAELAANGTTIVVVLHELGPLQPVLTRAVVLEDGAVAYDGPVADTPAHLDPHFHDHDPHGDELEPISEAGSGPRPPIAPTPLRVSAHRPDHGAPP